MAAQEQRASVCRNCGAPVSGKYCPQCGQETSLRPLSVWEFSRELVSHYVAAEGKLWRTLALLTVLPGRLTVEYQAGRRQRYILPLRPYLTASFLFFAFSQWNAHVSPAALAEARKEIVNEQGSDDADSNLVDDAGAIFSFHLDRSDQLSLQQEHFDDCLAPQGNCSMVKRLLAPSMVQLQKDPQHALDRFSERFRRSLSYAMFLLLPVFALLLALAYRNRKRYYGEHLVFALHVHSFWFFLALAFLALPEAAAVVLPLAYIAHGLSALHRVYGGRWRFTLLRGATMLVLYSLVMGFGAAALSLALLAT